MILIVLAALCTLSVPLTGGNLARLGDLPLRGLWVPLAALGLQTIITSIAPGGSHSLHAWLHIASYAMLVGFLWRNRRIPGLRLIAVGTALNLSAIIANRGVMPAAVTAERLSGLVLHGGFRNSAPLAHPVLLWLGDIIPYPGPLPNVLSVGDVVIFAGLLVLLHRACRRPTGVRTGGIVLRPVLAHRGSGVVLRPVP